MSYGNNPPPPTGPSDESGHHPQGSPSPGQPSYGTPPPPAPQYGGPPPPQYGAAPQYGGPPQYGGAPQYDPNAYGQAPGYPQAPAQTNSKARLSMILALVGLVICGILGPVAIILSRQATSEIAASGGRQSGAGMAKAGFIIGIIVTVLWGIGLLVRLTGAGS